MRTKQRNLKIGIRILQHAFMYQCLQAGVRHKQSAHSIKQPYRGTLLLLDYQKKALQAELYNRPLDIVSPLGVML